MKSNFALHLSALTALGLAALFTAGCGSSNPVGLNGNYQFTATSTPPNPTTGPGFAKPDMKIFPTLPSFAGSLTEKSGVVSGVLQNLNGPCFSFNGDISVTGNLKPGQLTLTSSAVQGEVLTVNATISTDDATITAGTYTIAGTCADKGTITGLRVPPLHGTYTGDFKSDLTGTTIHTSVQLAQMPLADAHGIFHMTAAATFSGSSCFTKGSVTDPANGSIVIGSLNGVMLKTDEKAGSTVTSIGVYDPATKSVTSFYSVSGGACNGDRGTGTLTLQ